MITKRYTGIGSRETPIAVCQLAARFANILAELGYALNSGGCPLGMDKACMTGAYKHTTFDKSKNRIYLSWDGMADLYHDPANGIFDAQRFENYQQAHDIALKARGSWERAGAKGILHHTRNSYQPLCDDLATPTDFVFLWAPYKRKSGGPEVKGGTATAVRIALDHEIPIYNLIDDNFRAEIEYFCDTVFLQKQEKIANGEYREESLLRLSGIRADIQGLLRKG